MGGVNEKYNSWPEAEIPSERASNALWKVLTRPEIFFRLERIFGQLPYIWESVCLIFRNVWKTFFFTASEPSKLLWGFPENLDWFQTNTQESFQLLSSRNFTECLESFAQYGYLPDKIKIFQTVRNVLKLKLPDCLQNFRIIFTLSRSSGSCQVRLETCRIF